MQELSRDFLHRKQIDKSSFVLAITFRLGMEGKRKMRHWWLGVHSRSDFPTMGLEVKVKGVNVHFPMIHHPVSFCHIFISHKIYKTLTFPHGGMPFRETCFKSLDFYWEHTVGMSKNGRICLISALVFLPDENARPLLHHRNEIKSLSSCLLPCSSFPAKWIRLEMRSIRFKILVVDSMVSVLRRVIHRTIHLLMAWLMSSYGKWSEFQKGSGYSPSCGEAMSSSSKRNIIRGGWWSWPVWSYPNVPSLVSDNYTGGDVVARAGRVNDKLIPWKTLCTHQAN